MSKTCPNCGCRMYQGRCENCDEESFIFDQDCETVRIGGEHTEFSEDFMNKVYSQYANAHTGGRP